ncbi:MAG: hypothetical protein IJ633_01450 [Prevotella sp.]|nr:hypothetical protein [Prevotella sp.]
MRKYSVLFVLLFQSIAMTAQDSVQVSLGADLVSHYIWRGQDLGHVSVQPTLGIGYKGLSLSLWGSAGISKHEDPYEIDVTLDYTWRGLTIGLTDYWSDEGYDHDTKYFDYAAHTTSHTLEAHLCYDFGWASLGWYTNFAGYDGVNKKDKRAYSSYLEASVPFLLGGCEWSATIGAVPYATTFYDTNGFAITSLSLRATYPLAVSKTFSLPLFAEVHANPRQEKMWFLLGMTISPW